MKNELVETPQAEQMSNDELSSLFWELNEKMYESGKDIFDDEYYELSIRKDAIGVELNNRYRR